MNERHKSHSIGEPAGVAHGQDSEFPRVYVVILNWNGWRDTIECLESVFRLSYGNFRVILCDNASTDGSLDKIKAWADGVLIAPEPANLLLSGLSQPHIRKPLAYRQIDATNLEARITAGEECLTIIESRSNRGFAGGNNLALRLLRRNDNWDYVWLLNNDTVVPSDSLAALIKRMHEKPDAGICGSTLLFYNQPRKVQACGGAIYNRWAARINHIGELTSADQLPQEAAVEEVIDYVVGASMLVSRRFLQHIGPLEESYFLYFEEIDWACRSRGRYSLAYSRDSIVYHKEGASAGTARQARNQSAIAEYYSTRNRLKFTARFFPYALPTVCFAVFASALERAVHRRWQNLKMICRALAMQEPDFFQ